MTDKATMPEVIYDSLASVAGRMAALIKDGKCCDRDYCATEEAENALTSYNALMKGR